MPNSAGYGRNTVWDYRLIGEHKFNWARYNKARYFNGGGQLRVSLNMTGGSSSYYNWSDVINEMGVLTSFDNVFKVRLLQVEPMKAKDFRIHLKYGDGSDGPNYKRRLAFIPSGVTIGRKVGTYGSTYGYGYGYITGEGNYPLGLIQEAEVRYAWVWLWLDTVAYMCHIVLIAHTGLIKIIRKIYLIMRWSTI